MRTPLEDHLKEYTNDPEYAREYDKAWVKTKKEVYQFPKSINFNKMNQATFDTFYDRALHILSEYLGVSIDDLENGSLDNL